MHIIPGKKNKSLNQFLISLTNKKPKRLAITNGIMPTVKAMPAKSHLSSIASRCDICVLCVKYAIKLITTNTCGS